MKTKNKSLIFISIGLVIMLLSFPFYFINGKTKTNDDTNKIKYSFVKSNDKSIKSKVTFLIPEGMKPKESINGDFYNYYENKKGDYLSAYIKEESKKVSEYVKDLFNTNNEIYSKKGYKVNSSDIECQYTCKRYTIYDKAGPLYADELRIFIKTSPTEIFDLTYHMENEEVSNSLIDNIVNSISVTNDASYLIGKVKNDKLHLDFKVNDDKTLSIVLDAKKYEELENNNNSSSKTYLKYNDTNDVIYLSIEYKKSKQTIKELVNGIYNMGKDPVDEIEIELDKLIIHKYSFDDSNCYVYEVDDNHILLMEVTGGMLNTYDFNNIKVKTNKN